MKDNWYLFVLWLFFIITVCFVQYASKDLPVIHHLNNIHIRTMSFDAIVWINVNTKWKNVSVCFSLNEDWQSKYYMFFFYFKLYTWTILMRHQIRVLNRFVKMSFWNVQMKLNSRLNHNNSTASPKKENTHIFSSLFVCLFVFLSHGFL